MKIIHDLLRYFRHINPFHKPQHRPPKSGLTPWGRLYLCKEDHGIITVWAKERGITNIAMGHILVTSFILCTEQRHQAEIERLTIKSNLLSSVLGDYIKRFGIGI